MVNYWSRIKSKKRVVGQVDVTRLRTSVLCGGSGVSMFQEDPKLRMDKKQYNFKVTEQVPSDALNNFKPHSATDYMDYAIGVTAKVGLSQFIICDSVEYIKMMHRDSVKINLTGAQYTKMVGVRADEIDK